MAEKPSRNADSPNRELQEKVRSLHRAAVLACRNKDFESALGHWQSALVLDPRAPFEPFVAKIQALIKQNGRPAESSQHGDDSATAPEWCAEGEEEPSSIDRDNVPVVTDHAILKEEAQDVSVLDFIPPKLTPGQRLRRSSKAIASLTLIVLFVAGSALNRNLYRIRLSNNTSYIDIYQGFFLPLGAEKVECYRMGIEPSWLDDLHDEELRTRLQSGMTFFRSHRLDRFLVDIFLRLGAFNRQADGEERLEKSLYFYKRAYTLSPGEYVRRELFDTATALAAHYRQRGQEKRIELLREAVAAFDRDGRYLKTLD